MNAVVRTFLYSNLSLVLVLLAAALGIAALLVTPREEDPQIIVPLADVYVNFPGHSAEEVERLVSTPLEKLLYQIDGVEYVYSMSQRDQAIITVRFYVGEDRERSLVKLYKRIDEHLELVPPGVTGWVVKPVEIDDVPIVTLTLTSAQADEHALRRVGEELVERLAAVPNTSRAYLIGGQPRQVHVWLDPDRMEAYGVGPHDLERAIDGANVLRTVGRFARGDEVVTVAAGPTFTDVTALRDVVVRVVGESPVFLKDVAEVRDEPGEVTQFVRHGWGPAHDYPAHHGFPGQRCGPPAVVPTTTGQALPAVTLAIAKKRGTNAVWVANAVLAEAERLRAEIVPDDMELVVTRNAGLTANEKVNELVEALAVAVFIVIALLTLALGWREALIVAVAVPVVFGLTLTVNYLCGYSINRVTLFALILSLGLLVDDPIVDVENIVRHFKMRLAATREIVVEAIAEIRPPLITATFAVIASFLPLFFITGMMGPYMGPMALNVPIAMLMSLLVAFTITPWMTYHVLRRRYAGQGVVPAGAGVDPDEAQAAAVRASKLYRSFAGLMRPLLRSRRAAWGFLGIMGALLVGTGLLAAVRAVPLKMLPFDNKNELLLVLDFDEGTTLERADACVRAMEALLATRTEVVNYISYVGTASPIDFNGLVRHYYLRQGPHVAEIRLNLVEKRSRSLQSHALGLALRDELEALATEHRALVSIVESPPGPPVIKTLVAEVRGQPHHGYDQLASTAEVIAARLRREPAVVEVDTSLETQPRRLTFVVDREKAALHGTTVRQIADTFAITLGGRTVGTIRDPAERQPLPIRLRLPEPLRSGAFELARLTVPGADGALTALSELGRWEEDTVERTIYHKNLQRVVYVFAEIAGRPPAEVVLDISADRRELAATGDSTPVEHVGNGWVSGAAPAPLATRTYFNNGGGVAWAIPPTFDLTFAGEGEWQITLDVFRDLGLAFAAALVAIYILLVAQLRSFGLPLVVMLAIPLTIIGIMPGFWLLNLLTAQNVGGYADPVFFTATGMIGMIALAGIVTRQAVIIIDFIHLSLQRGRGLVDAILESCTVRLRPILLTVATAMLSAAPIVIDPIFSGLAWALIFGLFASTVFTLFVIPVAYWLIYANRPGHGAAPVAAEPIGTGM
ncbi:MAG: efflux RND transporter permease subunit [Phycisphaerales bacterium]|nr:efflux RND transporter permease subunit [Phycisphaerales bacterium]